MNTIQSALSACLPNQIEQIRKQAKAAEFDRDAKRGEGLMLEAAKASAVGDATGALAAVRKGRGACACFLAKSLQVAVKKGYQELELMEQFWRDKDKEQKTQRQAAEEEARVTKIRVETEVAGIRAMGQKPVVA
jgi:hypothetical protein